MVVVIELLNLSLGGVLQNGAYVSEYAAYIGDEDLEKCHANQEVQDEGKAGSNE